MILSRSPRTAWRVIEGEAVILSLDTKAFRGLNPVGSRVWELIDGRRSVDEIVEAIAREFDVAPELAGSSTFPCADCMKPRLDPPFDAS
jgi:hypothetical protein